MNTPAPATRTRWLRAVLLTLVLALVPHITGVTGGAAVVAPLTTHTTAATPLPAQSTATGDLNFQVARLAGSDRYGTAAAVSARFFSPGAPIAFVATGANFPDGLAAGPAGARLGGPVLFATRTSLPTATRTELTRLRPGRIVVVGDTTAISSAVRTALEGYTTGSVTRVAGDDRIETAAALSRFTYPAGTAVAYVATARAFPDALAGGAAAGVQGAPMLLTEPGALPSATRAELLRLNPDRILLIGGTTAVSSSVAGQLAQIATTERVAGTDRYGTALAVARRVFGVNRPGVVVATGRNWPDALAAGPVVRFTRGPVLLSTGTTMPSGSQTELTRMTPTTAYLTGDKTAQGNGVPRAVQKWLGVCWSGTRPATGGQELFSSVPAAGKRLAFTLDMGGRLDPGRSIVQFLIDNQVCTTFFPTSSMADTTEGRAVVRLIAAHPELFEMANHTVHHCDLVRGGGGSPTLAPCDRTMTDSFIRAELADAEPLLEQRSGMPANPYWRPPYGSHDSRVRNLAASVGYTKTVMWNRDTIDWDPSTTTTQIVNRTVSPLPSNGTIVLAHLGGYRTRDALPQIVRTLRANGYTLTTVSDLRDG